MQESLEELIAKRNKRVEDEKELSIFELRSEELKKIKEDFNLPDYGKLYYPACGVDNSPTLAFPNWKVTYLDGVDEGLKDKVDVFVKGNLLNPPINFEDNFDAVLVVSPGIQFQDEEFAHYLEKVTENLKQGGFLICDDKHDTASLAESKENSFEKIFEPEEKKGLCVFKKL